MRYRRCLPVAALALALFASAGRATAAPITSWITVQPIDVCANDGSDCAQPPINLTTDEMAAQKIFAQAGLGVIFLPEHFYDNSSYLTTTVDPAGDPTDQAHLLWRLPNPAASPNPTTLNAYFVDNLVATTGVPIYGSGLIGSNGAIISEGGAIDTLAHELGHNLGLIHVDGTPQDDPNNLMRSVGRNVPATLADITPDGASDVLNASQIAQVQQPLFTVDLAHATVDRNATSCTVYIHSFGGCVFGLDFPSANTNESLLEVKVRFLPGAQVASFISDMVGNLGPSCNQVGDATVSSLPDGGTEADYQFAPGCFIAGNDALLGWQYPPNFVADPVSFDYTPPFSFEFDFSTGVTSTALYDATGDSASSTGDVTLGFSGVPSYGIGVMVPDPSTAPTDVDDNPAPVPEPAPLLLLMTGLAMLLPLRRPHRG